MALSPELSASFRRDVERLTKTALAGVTVPVTVTAELSRGFRADLAREVKAVTAGTDIEVPVQAVLGKAFRARLAQLVKTATERTAVDVPLAPVLGKGFRTKLQTAIRALRPVEAEVAMQVDRRSFVTFTEDLVRRAGVAADVASAAAVVRPEADLTRFDTGLAAGVEAGVAGVGAAADVAVGADTRRFATGLAVGVEEVTRTVGLSTDVAVGADTTKFDAALLAEVGAAVKAVGLSPAAEVSLRPDTAAFSAAVAAQTAAITRAVSGSPAAVIDFGADTSRIGPELTAKLSAAVAAQHAAVPIRADLTKLQTQLAAEVKTITETVAASDAAGIAVRPETEAFAAALAARLGEVTTAISATDAASIEIRADLLALRGQLLTELAPITSLIGASAAAGVPIHADVTAMAAELEAKVAAITTAVGLSEAGSIEIRADTHGAAAEIAGVGAASKVAGAESSGLAGGLTAAAVAAAGVAVAAGGAAFGLFKVGQSFDDAFDLIRIQTGKTGPELAGLEQQFRDVAKDTPAGFDEIAGAVAGVNRRLDLTGPAAEGVTRQFLEMSRITGTDLTANLTNAAGALQSFQVPAGEIPGALDALFRASQQSGVAVDELAGKVQASGAALRVAGFDFDESTALIAQLERAGIPAERVISSLSIAARKLADAGKDPAQGIADLVGQIKAAKTPTEALSIATDTFGRGAVGITDAIRSGKFELDDFLESVKGGRETILDTAAATADASEAWATLKNNIKLTLEAPAAGLFTEVGDAVKGLLPFMEELAPAIRELVGGLGDAAVGLIRGLVPVITGLVPAIAPFGDILGDIFGIVGELAGALAQTLAPVLIGLADALGPLVTLIARDLASGLKVMLPSLVEFGTILGSALADLAPALTEVFQAGFEAIRPVLPQIADALVEVAQAFADMLPDLVKLALPLLKISTIFFSKVQIPIILGIVSALLAVVHVFEPITKAVIGILAAGLSKVADLFGRIADIGSGVAGAVGGLLSHVGIGHKPMKDFADATGAAATGVGGLGAAAAAAHGTLDPLTGGVDASAVAASELGGAADVATGGVTGLAGAASDAEAPVTDLAGTFNDATREFKLFTSAADLVKTAFDSIIDAASGRASTVADVTLGIIDAGRTYLGIQEDIADGTISGTEGALKQMQLVLGSQRDVNAAFKDFAIDAGGDFDVFSSKVTEFGLHLTQDTAKALGITTGQAGDLVEQMLHIPTRAEFEAINNLPEVIAATEEYHKEIDDLPDSAETTTTIHTAASRTALKRLRDEVGAFVRTPLIIQAQLDDRGLQAALRRLRSGIVGGGRFVIEGFAEGGIVRHPTLALVAEAGPEVVLPLTDRRRMLELLREAGVLDGPSAVALSAPSGVVLPPPMPTPPPRPPGTPRVPSLPLPKWVGDTAALSDWVDDATGLFGKLRSAIVRFVDEATVLLGDWPNRVNRVTLAPLETWAHTVGEIGAAAGNGLVAGMRAGAEEAGRIAKWMAALAVPATAATGGVVPSDEWWNPINWGLAGGGHVPGPRVDRDIVPAMLMPGEVVIRRSSVDRFGLDELLALNKGIVPPGWVVPRRFAEGGVVPPPQPTPGGVVDGGAWVLARRYRDTPPAGPAAIPGGVVDGGVWRVLRRHVEAGSFLAALPPPQFPDSPLWPSLAASRLFPAPTPPAWPTGAQHAAVVPQSAEVRRWFDRQVVSYRDGGEVHPPLFPVPVAPLLTHEAEGVLIRVLHESGQAQRIVELAEAPSAFDRARSIAHSLSVEFGQRPAERTAGDERPVGEAVKAALDRFEQRSLAILAAALDQRPLVGSLTVEGRGDGRKDAATIVRELRAERFRAGL